MQMDTTSLIVTKEEAIQEFFRLLDITEESDSGHVFKPNQISSCRVMDGLKINECLAVLKNWADHCE